MGHLHSRAANREWNQPERKRSVLQPTKLNGAGDLKSALVQSSTERKDKGGENRTKHRS
ncbi:hypothetical protein ACRRTK_005665 [Alexandromys fortis]